MLNGRVIRAFFIQVTKECTTRNVSIANRTDLPEDVAAWMKRLHRLNSLWMHPNLYESTFGVSPDEPRYGQVDGDCEACILARIGGNVQAIYDLECSALTRERKNHEEPRILKLIDGWMNERGMDDENHPLYQVSLSMQAQVKKVRRQMYDERRRKQDGREVRPRPRPLGFIGVPPSSSSSRPSLMPVQPNPEPPEPYGFVEDEVEDQNEDQDTVDSIIGFYAYRQSTVASLVPTESMHPAYQRPESSAVDRKGKGRASQIPPAPRASATYSESVYSQQGGFGGAYDPNSPYMPPHHRLSPKTPAEKPTRPAPGPPPAASASFFKKLEHKDQDEEWEDDTVHTEVTGSTPSLREAEQTTKDRADTYRVLFGRSPTRESTDLLVSKGRTAEDRARDYQASIDPLAPTPSPSPSPPRPSGSRRRRRREGARNTNWGDFFK